MAVAAAQKEITNENDQCVAVLGILLHNVLFLQTYCVQVFSYDWSSGTHV